MNSPVSAGFQKFTMALKNNIKWNFTAPDVFVRMA